MQKLTQLKMEIRRQSGETAVGMVPVNQENFILGSTRVCLKEHRSGQLQSVSLHLNLLQEDHWIFDGLDQKTPIRVFVPLDPKPEKMTAMYMFADWWTRPAFAERFEDIPPEHRSSCSKAKTNVPALSLW